MFSLRQGTVLCLPYLVTKKQRTSPYPAVRPVRFRSYSQNFGLGKTPFAVPLPKNTIPHPSCSESFLYFSIHMPMCQEISGGSMPRTQNRPCIIYMYFLLRRSSTAKAVPLNSNIVVATGSNAVSPVWGTKRALGCASRISSLAPRISIAR